MTFRKMNTWDELVELVYQLSSKYKGKVHDSRAGRDWDMGQAVCAELYGPDWMNHPKFLRHESDHELPPPPEALEAARRMLEKLPDWAHEE